MRQPTVRFKWLWCVLLYMPKELRWRCKECDTVNTATNRRHSMDYCECGESWVDYEVAYSRGSIGVEYIDE